MSTTLQDIQLPDTPTPTPVTAKPVAAKPSRPARKAPAKPVSQPALKTVASVKAAKASPAPTKAIAEPVLAPARKAAAKPALPTKSEAKAPKAAKVKLVRDSFTIPSDEYALLAQLKQRALSSAHPAKKSELLRAGIKVLSSLSDAALLRALKDVPVIKTGRPKSKKGE